MDQRGQTDRSLSVFRDYLKQVPRDSLDDDFAARLRDCVDRLDKLVAHRQAVDNLGIATKLAIDYYTEMNEVFLSRIVKVFELSPDLSLMRMGLAYSNFLMAKERVGIQRAMLNNTIAGGKFSPGVFN